MTTPDQLLGGHAPGTLTEAEKARLYRAALEDQALFDQLMDEEALRDLLADPVAKARLLEALAPPRVVPFHRRPWVLASAAGLVMGLVTTWNALRTKPMPPQPSPAPQPTAEAAAPAPRALKAPAQASPRTSQPAAPVRPAPLDEAAPTLEPRPLLGATVPLEEKPAAAVPAKEETRTVEVVAATAVHDLSKAETALQASKRVGPAMAAPPRGELEVLLPPQWRLEEAGEGRQRLHLTLSQGGFPYLLCRTEAGVKVVVGEGTGPERTWLLQSVPGARWDLYVLPRLASDPARLPEKGLREGWHQRITW